MADLGNLSIQITASTSQANKSIDSLIGRLGALGKALETNTSKTAISGLYNLASGLSQFANASNSVDAGNLSAFATSLGNLAKEGAKLSNLNLATLATGLKNLQSVHISADKFAGIDVLSKSLGKLTGANYEKAKTALPTLAKSLSSFSGITIPNYSAKLIALAEALGKFGSKAVGRAQSLPQIAEGLSSLASSLNSFQEDQFGKAEGLLSLSNSISKFGNKNMQQAVALLPELTTSFTNLMSAVASAPQVSTQTVRFAEAMAQLAATSRSTSSAMNSLADGTSMFRNSILGTLPAMKKVRNHTFSLASMFGKLYASYFLVIRAFRGLGKAINVSAALTEVENVVASVFGDMTAKIDEFADTSMYKFGLAELSAKQYASKFQAMGQAMGITTKQVADSTDFLTEKLKGTKRDIEGVEDSYADLGNTMADMSINLTKLVSDYASFFNMDYDDVAKDFESIFTGSTRPMRAYGIDLTNATLAEWAMKNGLDADVKSMTQAEKTMLRYQYVLAQSGKVMNDYQITMNNWANVTRTIGQQFQKLGSIIGQGLINVFKPVLIKFRNFLNTFIDLTQKALNAIGKLLGWQIEIEEVGTTMDDGMEDYADSIGEAAGNAKKLNAQLRSIDELNNLTSGNDGGSGGDSGFGVLGGGAGAKATGGAIRFKDYESDIDSWFDLGKRISDKIKDALNSIKWENVFQKARNFGKNLAEFLNGLIQPETFYAVGRTIANAINTAIEFAYSFGTNFDFTNLGESIASGINGFFENFNFAKLAKTINKWVEGIKTTIKTIIKKVKWGKVFEGMWDFFSNLSFDTYFIVGLANLTKIIALFKTLPSVLTKIGTVFSKLSGKATAVVSAFDFAYARQGLGVTAGINAGINELTKNLTSAQKTLIGIGSAIGEFALLSNGVKKLTTDSENLGEAIVEMIAGITAGAAGLTLVLGFPYGIIAAGIIGITGALYGLGQGLNELDTSRFAQSIQNALKNENGVPIDQYIDTLTAKFEEMTNGFSLISEKSSNLDSAKKNVNDLVFEISRIQTEMNAGVKSVEDGTAELDTLFGELQEAISTKLQAAAGVLYATFAEGGVVAEVYGYSEDVLKDYREQVALSTSEVEKQTSALFEKLYETEYGTPEWYSILGQIQEINTGVNTLKKDYEECQKTISNSGLNWDNYFDVNTGELQIGLLAEDLNGLTDSALQFSSTLDTTVKTDIADAFNQINQIDLKPMQDELENNLPTAMENANKLTGGEIKKLTDQIQYDLLDNIDSMMEEWGKEYDESNWFERAWNGFFSGNQNEGDRQEWIYMRLNQYMNTVVDPVSEEIESSLNQLGVDGAGWGSDAMEQIYNGLFDVGFNEDGKYVATLKENWQSILDESLSGLELSDTGNSKITKTTSDVVDSFYTSLQEEVQNHINDFKESGEYAVYGSLEGETDVPYSEYLPYAKTVKDRIDDALRQELGIESPAEEMKPIGMYIVEGVLEGFGLVDFASGMSKWWDENVKPFFSMERWSEIGQSAADGLLPQVNAMCTAIQDSFLDLANSVVWVWGDLVTTVNNAMKNLEVPKFDVKNVNGVPSIDVKFYAQGGFPQTGSLFYAGEAGAELLGSVNGRTTVASNGEITGISDTIRQTSSEEIALLRQQNQLLQGILQKEFGISKDQVFKSVRSSASEYTKMTGNPAFV